MKFFLDSAKIEEIRYAYKHWGIDGVTTNPRHIMVSGKSFLTVIKELATEFKDVAFPISVEIDPHLTQAEEMVEAGKTIAQYSSNFIVKLPCTEQGLVAAKTLETLGIKTNVTLVFSPSQAIQAGRIKAHYVSPFVAWLENSGDDGMTYVEDIVQIYKNYNFETEIIVAAVRTGFQIAKAAKMGADIVTCGFDVYKESFYHAYTNHGLGVFTKAWEGTKQEE